MVAKDKTNDCTITYDATNAPQTFTVSIPVWDRKYEIGANIEVTYTATVNKDAVAIISSNKAKLTYSNDPTTDEVTDSQTEEQKVYTSKIVIDKFETGKQETTKLEGAQFVLYKEVKPADGGEATKLYYKWNDTDVSNKKVEWVTTHG